jgi:hypothetical protein
MNRTAPGFQEILLRRQIVTAAQLQELQRRGKLDSLRLAEAVIRAGFADARKVMTALAECHGMKFLDLTNVFVPDDVLELVPESVARENVVLPFSKSNGTLVVIISDPADSQTLQKLQFILNRDIHPMLGLREQIVEAIDLHYGMAQTESVDSTLAEFTDTAIDFTRTDGPSIDLEDTMAMGDKPPQIRRMKRRMASADQPVPVERRATVRYYHRMNPERMFPLLVVLSRQSLQEVVKRGVAQAESAGFRVALDSLVEVEPIVPGCCCYPPKEQMKVCGGEASVTFWVVPHVLGEVMHARVVLRQNGSVLAEVPLKIRVVKQGITLLLGALSLLLPLGLMVLKHFRLDFESQLEDGFGLYATAAHWLVRSLSPEALMGLLLAATGGAYFWLRPRKRDVFWDIEPAASANSGGPPQHLRREWESIGALVGTPSQSPTDRFARAKELLKEGDCETALELYEEGLVEKPQQPSFYFEAGVAAYKLGDFARAFLILKTAEERLGPARLTGPMWYNLGCLASRLGRWPDALRYLNRAVDAGYANPAKYRTDPDLMPLRWRPEYKRLLRDLQVR